MPHNRRLMVAGVALLIGCTRVSDQSRFEPIADRIEILDTVPDPGATAVPTMAQIDLCWSGLVDPRSVGDLDAIITSGNTFVDARVAVQLWPWRGPANEEGVPQAPWCSGSVLSVTPKAELVASVQYRLSLQDNAVGWAGESIDTERSGWIEDENGGDLFFLEFTVEDDPPTPPPDDGEPPPPGMSLAELFEPDGIFDPDRGLCSCHRGDDPEAQALLDLSSPAAAFNDLVIPTALRDTGFPMITPRRPSESFLLHKLLRDADNAAIYGVRGDAMPPPDFARQIPYRDYVAVATWIEDGALP